MRKQLFILLIAVLAGHHTISSGTENQVRHLTPESGLNNGSVNDIVQDSSGYIWLATWDGIARYDGYTFKTYKPDVSNSRSLQARQVFKLMVDSRGTLWALSYGGIARYNTKLDHFERVELEDEGTVYVLPSPPHSEMIEASGYLIYRRFRDLYCYALDSGKKQALFRKINSSVNVDQINMNICEVEDQMHLIRRYPERTETEVSKVEINETASECKLEELSSVTYAGMIYEILALEGNMYAVRMENRFGILPNNDTSKRIETLVENKSISKQLITSNHELWYIPADFGLGRVDLHTGESEFYEYDSESSTLLLGNKISSIFEDFSGNLWIGHGGEGVSIMNLKQKAFNTFRHSPDDPTSLAGNSVMCFQETDDGILVGTDYDGVNFLRQDPLLGTRVFERINFPEHFWTPQTFISVWNIAREDANTYWLASNMGLIKSERKGEHWSHEQHFITQNQGLKHRKILLDQQQNMWLGTYEGLFLLPANQRDSMGYFQYVPDDSKPGGLTDITITEIMIDSKDRMWIGTRDGGIHLLDRSYSSLNLASKTAPDLNFIIFNAGFGEESLNNNEINCLFEYYDGTIWAGTQGGGINILDPESGEISYITQRDGLPGNNVFGILSDDQGNLWMSTNKGLCSLTTYGSERKISSYGPADGIQGNVFMINSFFKDSRDMLYFGGRNGFTRFLPSQIQDNRIPPKIAFTELLVFGKRVDINQTRHKKTPLTRVLNETDTLVLSYKDYSLRIGISAIHFQNPLGNKILYKLDGFDRIWNQLPPEERHINLSNLDPGSYTLMVKASNSDGFWAEDVRKLELVITPPWYKTWYGYIIFVILAVSMISLLFRLILKQQVLRHKIRLDEVQIENMKVLNETKLKFFTNISHELRTPLNLVLAPIEYIYKSKDIAPVVRDQLFMSLRNAKLLKRLITNIIDFRKFEADKLQLKHQRSDLAGFLRQIGKNFEILQPSMDIHLMYHVPEEQLLADFDISKMEQVLYNILSNAFKHTVRGGTILITLQHNLNRSVALTSKEESIAISIFNEGKLIPENKIEKIFDRFYQAEEQSEGSGIGLSVARSLIELHDGDITARNIEESGVEFRIEFPRFTDASKLVDETPAELIMEDHSGLAGNLTVIKPQNPADGDAREELKILVIEDNAELRSFYETLFSAKFWFFEAVNGAEGIRMAEEIIPDIIISDVVMPEKDGYEVCQHIKSNVHTCHIPVILLTAKGAPDQIVNGYNSGADAYVVKPFESEVLLSQVDGMLQNRDIMREKYSSPSVFVDHKTGEPRSKDDIFMKTLNEELEKNLFNEDYNVVSLSKKLNISRNHLYRKVKALTNYSTVEYIRIYKLNKAAELLKTQKYSIKEVCFKTGFNDQSYFTKSFKNHFNQNPTEFIRSYSKAQ